MKVKVFLLSSLCLMLCEGCQTSYQDAAAGGGLRHSAQESGHMLVEAKGNRFTDLGTVLDHAILKAAELTRDAGKQYFDLIHVKNQTPDQPELRRYSADFLRRNASTPVFERTNSVKRPTVVMAIKIVDAPQYQQGPYKRFNAQEIISTLGPKYLEE